DDHWHHFVAAQHYFDSAVHSGTWPLWNPFSFSGQPFAGNPGTRIFYPPNMIRSLLNSNPTVLSTVNSLVLAYLFHFIVLGAGLYALARKFALSRAASTIALLVALTSITILRTAFVTNAFLYTACWTPWVLFGLLQAHTAPSKLMRARWTVATGLIYGVQFLAAATQVTIIETVVYIVFAYALTLLMPNEKKPGLKSWIATTYFLALFGIIGALCATAMLLPTFDFSHVSARSGSDETSGLLNLSFLSFARTTFIVLPDAEPAYANVLRYINLAFLSTIACQVSFIVLIAGSIFHRHRRVFALVVILAYVVFDCSMGEPFPLATLINMIRPFAFTISTYSAVLMVIPMGLLAAIGYDAVVSQSTAETRSRTRIAYWVMIGSVSTFLFVYQTRDFSITERFTIPIRWMDLLPILALCIFLVVLRWKPTVAAWCLITAGLIETGLWVNDFTDHPKPRATFENLADTTTRFELSNRRELNIQHPNLHVLSSKEYVGGYDPLHHGGLAALIKDPSDDYHYTRIVLPRHTYKNSFSSLFVKRKFWLSRAYVRGALPETGTLFAPTEYVFINEPSETTQIPELARESLTNSATSSQSLPENIWNPDKWVTTTEADTGFVSTMLSPILAPSTLHKALRIHITADSKLDIRFQLSEVIDGKIAGHHIAGPFEAVDDEGDSKPIEWPLPDYEEMMIRMIIEPDSRGVPFEVVKIDRMLDEMDEADKIQIVDFGANRIKVEVSDLEGPRLLTFASPYFPGWKVMVDSAPADLLRVNDLFMAAEVPAGNHTIEFYYRPPAVFAGIAIALTTVITSFIFLVVTHYRVKKKSTKALNA
ncbi:MAG: YfhO family protein, partial [Candidatus Hydrogenedentota bacterium]